MAVRTTKRPVASMLVLSTGARHIGATAALGPVDDVTSDLAGGAWSAADLAEPLAALVLVALLIVLFVAVIVAGLHGSRRRS